MKTGWFLPVYCRLAGSADLVTGVLLVTVPALTLGLMGTTQPVTDLTWVRWVGVFVAAVGLLYWLPDLLRSSDPWSRRRGVLESTTVVRLAVASFVGWALATGRLEPAFASVLVTDLALGVAQIVILHRLPERRLA